MGALHIALLAVAVGPAETVLLDFTAPWCGPCQRMAPIVDSLAARNYPVRKVDLDTNRELAAQYGVTSIPCFVLLKDGREVDRILGATSGEELVAMLARHGVAPAAAQADKPGGLFGGALSRLTGGRMFGRGREAAPTEAAASEAPAYEPQVEMGEAVMPGGSGAPATFAQAGDAPAALAPPASYAQPAASPSSQPQPSAAAAGDNGLTARLLAATVRLRIEDAGGNSVGTGTIVDAREGEALVLTCGHIFRDSQGKGRISIDLFAPALNNLPGRLISYDLDSDVALVAFRPGGPVTVARIAPAMYTVREGDAVTTVGCDHGQAPTAIASRVLSVNRFQGQPNLQVAGQPVQGRSGGGLFSTDGQVIGVCNAADPQDNQGLFAALGAIHAELDEMQLSDIYQGDSVAAATPGAPAPLGGPATAPAMADEMPAANPPAGSVAPLAVATIEPGGGAASGGDGSALSPQEQAALAEIQARAGEAEVVCIIRPLADPNAKSEIIVLNQASPEFVRQLAEASRRTGRQLTSMQTRRAGNAVATQPATPEAIEWRPSARASALGGP